MAGSNTSAQSKQKFVFYLFFKI